MGWLVTATGKIYGTRNGGQSWQKLVDEPNNPPQAICYANGPLYAVGKNGRIMRSNNFGVSWINQSSGVSSDLNDVSFVNDSVGWAVGNTGIVLMLDRVCCTRPWMAVQAGAVTETAVSPIIP